MEDNKGWIFNIQRYSTQDGPGIRTTVFFVGCPLKCLWCSNPESQFMGPKLLYIKSKCTRCKRCIEICPNNANSIDSDGFISIDRDKCVSCGKCVEICPNEARIISGELKTVDEVMEVVKKDSIFYRNSGGGATASGGEPTSQSDFLIEFFRACKRSRIHTTLDTCGCTRWEVFEKILPYTDLILYDIKHMDTAKHVELTGVDNKLILQNAERIAKTGTTLIIRVPLIPGCNDSQENMKNLAIFANRLGIHRIDLLPYHELGAGKYTRLGMKYVMTGTKHLQKEEVNPIKMDLESYGLEVNII